MKIQSCVSVALLLLSLLTIPGCNVAKPENITLEPEYIGASTLSLILALDKTLYTSNEEIEADVLIRNIGTGDIIVNARMDPILLPVLGNGSELEGELLFVIESPSGNRATTRGNWNIRRIVESDFIVLSPRRGILGSYDLQRYFILDELGTYSIFVIYHNQIAPEKGSAAWKGELTSNTVHFDIAP